MVPSTGYNVQRSIRTSRGRSRGRTMLCGGLCLLAFWLIPCQARLRHPANVAPAAPATGSVQYSYETRHFTQKLDHFNFADGRTFTQRYLVNSSYWVPGGPVFFYCGNEGDITWFCNNTGMMWDIAPKFKAMLVFAEHRYYGETLPFGKDSYKDATHLGYLSSAQALADFDSLIAHLHSSVPGAGDSPVIAFGGSYGGMLASWLRMKYPASVQGALAASAPIWQFVNLTECNVAYEIITNDFKRLTPNCALNVQASWDSMLRVAKSSGGLTWLSETFHLCDPLADVEGLAGWFESVYFNMAMVDYPYPSDFLEPLPSWPVNVFCAHLKESIKDDKQLLQTLFEAVNVYFNYTGSAACLNLSEDAVSYLGEEGWDYQACTEMIMPLCTDGVHDMFRPHPWDLDALTESCQKQYGVTPQPNAIIEEYGGKDIGAHSNIVFSNGNLDPWSGGGVLQSISDSLVAIVIPDGAHHLDLRAATPEDPPDLTKTRLLEESYIEKWSSGV